MEKLIFCNDGCLACMIAKKNANDTWEIYGISKVYGMGAAEYKHKLFNFVISDIYLLNSMEGKSYVCLKKEQKWGLLELKNGKGEVCKWKIISEFKYNNTDEMLLEFKINKTDYYIE